MHWMRKPRLNSAVATVAVDTVLSLLRVASLSLGIALLAPPFRQSGMRRNGAGPISILPIVAMDSGLAATRRPGMTKSINRGLVDRLAETGLEEVEVAAFIGLPDVLGEHPAIAALEPARGLLPCGAAFCELGFAHIEIDGARGNISVILSPFFTSASGPPTKDSGETCRMQAP